MENILLLTSFCLTLYTWKSWFFHKSALFIFNLLWFIIFVMYYFRIDGLYDAREGTFLMYFLGIVFFFFGYVAFNIFWPKKLNLKGLWSPKVNFKWHVNFKVIKRRILVFLTFLSIYIFLYKSFLAIPYWLSGGMGEVKTSIIMESALSIGTFGDIAFVYVAKPIHYALSIYCVILIFQGNKDRFVYVSTALLIVLGFVCSGSRFSLVEIVVSALAYLFMFTNLNLKQFINKYRKLSMPIILIGAVVLIFMGISGDLLGTVNAYLCGCIPCSDNAILRIDDSFNYYGIVTFNGVLRVINQIPSMLGLTPGIKEILDMSYEYMIRFEETTYIGDGIRYNAFISMFTYFYADAGLKGVCVLSALFGGFTAIINKTAFANPTYRNCALLLLVVIMISNSMVRIQTFLVPTVMAFVYIYFIVPNEMIELNQVNEELSVNAIDDEDLNIEK